MKTFGFIWKSKIRLKHQSKYICTELVACAVFEMMLNMDAQSPFDTKHYSSKFTNDQPGIFYDNLLNHLGQVHTVIFMFVVLQR